MGAVDKLVDGLDKVLVELFALLLLFRPVVGAGLCISAVDLVMVLDQGINGIGCEFVGDFVAQDHVDVNNVGLDVNELVAEELLEGLLGHFGFGKFRQHEGGKSPDGVG